MELVECCLDISWHIDIQYSGPVVPVKCDVNVKTPFPILCYFLFVLD